MLEAKKNSPSSSSHVNNIQQLRGIFPSSHIQANSQQPYRRVIDIEKLGPENFSETKYLWGFSLARTIENNRFGNLTPHQHKRHSHFAAILLGAYSHKIFYEKNAKRHLKNLKRYLSPKNTKSKVDFWCDFLDAFEQQLKIDFPKAKIEYMDVEYPYGTSPKTKQKNPTPPPPLKDGQINIIDIAKLDNIKDKNGKPVKLTHAIPTLFRQDNPLYYTRHSMPEAAKQLKFNSDIVLAYSKKLKTKDILNGLKSRYNLQGRKCSYEGQQMYIRFLTELEKIIKNIPEIDVSTIPYEKIDLLKYNRNKDPLTEKMEMLQSKLSYRMGKTGNLSTKTVTQEDAFTAKEQTKISKEMMLKRRGKGAR